ncbi:MAG: DUF1566 domain-containing protein, partial [Paraglaciecola sp.]|nr:DUF1566 domain-containing protein [Paraglaciecola sp.]
MRVLCILGFFVSYLASGQTCLSDYDSSAQAFVDNDNGTVTDTSLGLVWMSCSLGQTWDEGTCSGDASELTWQQALQAAHGYKFAEQLAWRVPNMKELASL